jgi:hypothetical protein
MNQETKQELEQLLHEAMETVVIEPPEGYEPISVEKYRECTKAYRESYRPDLSFILLYYRPNIQDDAVKSKLFNFMKEELVDYIREDESVPPYTHWIQTAKRAIRGARRLIPIPLDRILEKLLEIVIASGAEQAISALDRCTRDEIGTFQKIIFLKGLHVRYSGSATDVRETHVAAGIRFVQLPSYTVGQIWDLYESEQSGSVEPSSYAVSLPPYLFHERLIPNLLHESFIPMVDNTQSWFRQWSKFPMAFHLSILCDAPLLIIDYVVSPLFCKPPPLKKELDKSDQFEMKIESTELPNFDVDKFCQALSIIANYPVKSLITWQYIGGDELFNIDSPFPNEMGNFIMPDHLSGISVINETDIDKAKDLYELLTNLPSKIGGKLQIAIDRWIKSKTNRNDVDKMIDLGVAFESIYLPKNKTEQLSLSLRLRASWHLGKNKSERKKLIDEFDAIYTLRSQAVHNGELPQTVRIRKGNQNKPGKSVPISEFLPRAQELCRASIIKILKDLKVPDDAYWKDLILGEDAS